MIIVDQENITIGQLHAALTRLIDENKDCADYQIYIDNGAINLLPLSLALVDEKQEILQLS